MKFPLTKQKSKIKLDKKNYELISEKERKQNYGKYSTQRNWDYTLDGKIWKTTSTLRSGQPHYNKILAFRRLIEKNEDDVPF